MTDNAIQTDPDNHAAANFACIEQVFEKSCIDQITGLNCTIKRLPDSTETIANAPISTIEAVSSDLDIKVIMQLPIHILALTYPTGEILAVYDETLEDWISELSNQLIGKLKNELLKYGASVLINFPHAFYGNTVEELIPDHYPLHKIMNFDIDGQLFSCVLCVNQKNPALLLEKDPEADDQDIMTGDIEFF